MTSPAANTGGKKPTVEAYAVLPSGLTTEQLKDLLAETKAHELPPKVWPGMTLKWDSPFTEIWLLMPDTELTVSYQDCALKALIIGDGIEIQHNRVFRASHINAVYLGRRENPPSERIKAILQANTNGLVSRRTRTIVTWSTRALEDCLAAIEEGGRRAIDATQYFKSLIYAHFPYINKVINAYRKSAVDPFAMELSEWDVPIWFLSIGDKQKRISLIPYADSDEFPNVGSLKNTTSEPIHLAIEAEVQSALNLGEVPGDDDLLDAWALYYRGRFGDAIRSLVTAIEVVLDFNQA